jgi:hypothetical protein
VISMPLIQNYLFSRRIFCTTIQSIVTDVLRVIFIIRILRFRFILESIEAAVGVSLKNREKLYIRCLTRLK